VFDQLTIPSCGATAPKWCRVAHGRAFAARPWAPCGCAANLPGGTGA